MLKMCKSNCNLIRIFFCLFQNYGLQVAQTVHDFLNLSSHIEPSVHLTLVVPASCRVKLLPHIADPLNQPALDTHVDILIIHVKCNLSALDVPPDILKPCDNRILFLHRDDSLLAQHRHMCDTSVDIIVVHSLVESDGRIELLYNIIHLFLEPSSP